MTNVNDFRNGENEEHERGVQKKTGRRMAKRIRARQAVAAWQVRVGEVIEDADTPRHDSHGDVHELHHAVLTHC